MFKFVGGDEDYSAVWLHCDLQICINRECQPVSLIILYNAVRFSKLNDVNLYRVAKGEENEETP